MYLTFVLLLLSRCTYHGYSAAELQVCSLKRLFSSVLCLLTFCFSVAVTSHDCMVFVVYTVVMTWTFSLMLIVSCLLTVGLVGITWRNWLVYILGNSSV